MKTLDIRTTYGNVKRGSLLALNKHLFNIFLIEDSDGNVLIEGKDYMKQDMGWLVKILNSFDELVLTEWSEDMDYDIH